MVLCTIFLLVIWAYIRLFMCLHEPGRRVEIVGYTSVTKVSNLI